MIIQNNTKHLSQLLTNDRFVFFKERHKRNVWQVVEHITVTVNGEEKKMTKCINDKLEAKRFDSSRVVLYLRSANPQIIHRRLRNRRRQDNPENLINY